MDVWSVILGPESGNGDHNNTTSEVPCLLNVLLLSVSNLSGISQLVEDVQRLQASISKLQESSAGKIARLEEQLDHKRQHIARLESRLEAQRDYDDVKRELRTIEFPPLGPGGNPAEIPNQSIEMLLLERTKALQQVENAELKSTPTVADVEGSTTTTTTTNSTTSHHMLESHSHSMGHSFENSTAQPPPIPPPSTLPPSIIFPPPLQNVETFGSFLGEEIVANWRRSLERTILSQSHAAAISSSVHHHHHHQQQQQQHQQPLQHSHQPIVSLHSPTDPSQTAPSTPNPSTPQQSTSEMENNKIIESSESSRALSSSSTTSSAFATASTPTSLTLVNTTSAISSPLAAPTLTTTTSSAVSGGDISLPLHHHHHHHHHHLMNGNPKTPPEDSSQGSVLCSNNNNIHLSSNINTSHILNSSISGNGLSVNANLNNGIIVPPPTSTSISSGLNYFRNDDSIKSPFRFDDPRSPFRFSDEGGPMTPSGVMVGRLGESLIPKGDPMEARLQEMLRYNMDKYSTQNLDTLHISRRVRELLSINNIGQRLFAKYVLGLSQGTVSELLSKPKPWDKLTEKGRDSYRKMHAWACDENAVLLLKSLIPKKERIAHILSEASQMMKTQVEDSRSNDSKSPNHAQDGSQNRRLKKYENDDIPQEKVVRIYQEELAKLMGRRMEDSIRGPREHFPRELAKLNTVPNCPNVGSPGGIPVLPGLLALQQQALNQQQQHSQINGVAQDLSLPKERKELSGKIHNGGCNELEGDVKKDNIAAMESVADVLRHAGSAFSLVRPKTEPGVGHQPQTSTGSSASSPLSNSILPPAMAPGEDFVGSATASPLQRMASITNSLISQPSTPTHHSPSQRPLKAVLPPITQQQFDMFNNLNTEDIVKKVKESLSQYSISQRLFGESVLGLSQGSVSDLLARPKPWHMLTQKGREPFIRMKMFLEDDNAVHKLVASQYKIAPEKLMRTGSYAACPPLSKPLPPTLKLPAPDMISNKSLINENQSSILPPSLQMMQPHLQQSTNLPQPPPPPLLVTPSGLHGIVSLATGPLSEPKKSSQQNAPHHNMHGHHHSHQHHQQPPQQGQSSSALRAFQQHMTPSVYEMAALTQDLDTQTITTKIKEALLANNIGQKIFGEAVLGLSQGSVSELLSKPKPWHMLSIKGREPFIRMQLWLSDAHNIDRLQALKNERREANKRRRSSGQGHHGGGGADNSSDTSSNDTSEFYHSPSPGPGPPSAKKQRVLFSEEQKEALRLAFALDSYPSVQTIEFLGNELALSSRTITNWFHNHRMRLKQQIPHGMSPENAGVQPINRDSSSSQGSFDPVQFRLLLNQRLLEIQKERMGLGSVPLPYPPYFTSNNNLAALIGRGLLPSADCDLAGAINNVVNVTKEQYNGLDLSMGGLKREPDFEDDEDVESNIGSEDSNLSSSSLRENTIKKESASVMPPVFGSGGRSSRRKPAAPQWVNPEWQESSIRVDEIKDKGGEKEVIINGVCVMQTDDYGMKMDKDQETVRVEPTPVLDRYEDEDQCSEALSDVENRHTNVDSGERMQLSRAAEETEVEEEHRSAKSEPISPIEVQTELEENENENYVEGEVETAVDERHSKLTKHQEDPRGSSDEERRDEKNEWDISLDKRENKGGDILEKLPKRIKSEEQDDGWEY
uniref:Homeobox protein cut-like n=1 Tax=Timema monikensis TaxID=170555 RepID=A0A7R9E480_9NEOP|nr:unnamed protein product [Timema monikensis]